MKKRKVFSTSALLSCLIAALALMLSSCASLGVSSKGAEYFDGKKESALAKYFGYEGEVLAENGEDFDKMVYFSNKYITAYMDWSKTTYTKSRRYTDLDDIQFLEMSDGCYVARGNSHYVSHYDPGTRSTIGGSSGAVTVGQGGPTTYTTHRNDNGTVSAWINQFNSNVRSYGAIGFGDDSSRFNASNIGDSYYVYAKTSNSATLGDEYATLHHWYIERVDIYLDEQTQSDTQVAFHYSIPKDEYYAADRRTVISKDEALANVSGYESRGYALRKETKGLSLVAFIKDGVVIDVMQADSPSDLELDLNEALMIAAMGNSFGWVNELLLAGANPNIQDEEGWTALMHAVWSENARMVSLLLDAGANTNLQEYAYGGTALDMAEMKGNAEIIRMLSH